MAQARGVQVALSHPLEDHLAREDQLELMEGNVYIK